MDQQRRYRNALRHAVRTLGGTKPLCYLLSVAPEAMERWLSGIEAPPLEAFLGSLDVIADGPYARQRLVRVAVIRPEHYSSARNSDDADEAESPTKAQQAD